MMRLRIPIWSRLNRPQRILLLAALLIVVLYVMTVSSGGRDGDVDLSKPPGLIKGLGGLFGGPEAVDYADLSGSCLASGAMPPDGRLVIDGSCVLDIAPRDSDLRGLKLTGIDSVQVEAPVPFSDETSSKDLEPGDEITVSIDSDGGRVTMTCRSAGFCVVSVG
jgi:hypothetical protein